MSNLLMPLELHLLETVTGGGTKTARNPSTGTLGTLGLGTGTGSSSLLNTLTSLSTALKDIGTTAKKSGFSTLEVMMLGMLMNRGPVNVFVRRPYW